MTLTNWKIKTISSLCEKIYSGGTPNTKKREYWNGDLKWLSSGETRNKFIWCNSVNKDLIFLNFLNSE